MPSVYGRSAGVLSTRTLRSKITPQNVHQDNVVVPATPTKESWEVAKWLPVQFIKNDVLAGGEFPFVISKMKAVALDRQGKIVPAGLRKAFATSTTGATALVYTIDDYNWGTIDLTTGLPYAVAGSTPYSGLQVAQALVARGLVPEDAVGASAVTLVAHIANVAKAFVSLPVGVVQYDCHSNATQDKFINFKPQAGAQFITQVQGRFPHRVGASASDTVGTSAPSTTLYSAGDFISLGQKVAAIAIASLTRYSAVITSASPVFAVGLANKPVARNTVRTPITATTPGILVTEVSAPELVLAAGDFYVDYEVGVLFVHSSFATTGFSVVYFHYDTGALASSAQYVYFTGEIRPGDLVSIDALSNFVVKGSTLDALDASDFPVGRVHGALREPFSGTNKMHVPMDRPEFSATSRLPGAASTGHVSDAISHMGEIVSDKHVVVGLCFI